MVKKRSRTKGFQTTTKQNKTEKSREIISHLDFARKMYQEYGKGVVYFHETGLGYILPSHSDITQMDISMMQQVDYQNTFVVTRMFGDSSMFGTSICNADDSVFEPKLSVPKEWWKIEQLIFR